MKKTVLIIILIIFLVLSVSTGVFFVILNKKVKQTFSFEQEQETQIEELLRQRRSQKEALGDLSTADFFGKDGTVKILFIGLDNRIGETGGHCDAIQLIEVNKNKKNITITAVPRGTYSPLPGSGHQPTDYYVSKACEVGGLDYGIKQIERILGQKADYVVFLGFSQAMGIFRQMDLPANETMQWLRMRQPYAIGEPQRARNHSTFIKQMIAEFTPQFDSNLNLRLGQMLFKLLRTDLTFEQMIILAKTVLNIDVPNHPERVVLLMRPAYDVQDIPYDQENLSENIERLVKPMAGIIPENAYSGQTREDAQNRILSSINNGLADPEFVDWAFNNYLWLQLDDEDERESSYYKILEKYISLIEDLAEKEKLIADYIIEKEDLDQDFWAERGRELILTAID